MSPDIGDAGVVCGRGSVGGGGGGGGGFDGRSRVVDAVVVVAGSAEGLGAHVAAGDGPFVGLLGEQRADKADDGGSVGEDPHDVGAPADLLVQAFLRVVRADL